MSLSDDGRTIQATETSLEVIEELRRQDGASLTALADGLDLAKSTVHGHLKTLEKHGYVVRVDGEYHVALKFLHFGEYARNRDPRYELAKETVHELSDTTKEEVDFTVPEHGRLISLYHSFGDSSESGLQVGSYFYLHNTAAGKAIMAEWSTEKVRAVVEKWGLPADTELTITDVDELLAELRRTRERGYGVNDQEIMEGFQSLGAVVRTPDDEILGGLSIGGPTYRMEPRSEVVDRLLDGAERLETRLEKGPHEATDWWGQYFTSRE